MTPKSITTTKSSDACTKKIFTSLFAISSSFHQRSFHNKQTHLFQRFPFPLPQVQQRAAKFYVSCSPWGQQHQSNCRCICQHQGGSMKSSQRKETLLPLPHVVPLLHMLPRQWPLQKCIRIASRANQVAQVASCQVAQVVFQRFAVLLTKGCTVFFTKVLEAASTAEFSGIASSPCIYFCPNWSQYRHGERNTQGW